MSKNLIIFSPSVPKNYSILILSILYTVHMDKQLLHFVVILILSRGLIMAKMCHYKFGVKGWTVGRTESDFDAMYGPN